MTVGYHLYVLINKKCTFQTKDLTKLSKFEIFHFAMTVLIISISEQLYNLYDSHK